MWTDGVPLKALPRLSMRMHLIQVPDDRYFGISRLNPYSHIASFGKLSRILRCGALPKEWLLISAAVKASIGVVRINNCCIC